MTQIVIGVTEDNMLREFNLSMMNRHGLIAGATGTGKTCPSGKEVCLAHC